MTTSQKTQEKYPAVGCKRGYFVDTNSFRVPRGRVCLFYGFASDETKPDRTASATLVGVADSVEALKKSHPEAFKPAEMPTPFKNACDRYRTARAEYERLQDLADKSFRRWFGKSRAGEPTNAGAATRAANRANYASADLAAAENAVYRAADDAGFISVDLDAIYQNGSDS